jgi:hypothetical protein
MRASRNGEQHQRKARAHQQARSTVDRALLAAEACGERSTADPVEPLRSTNVRFNVPVSTTDPAPGLTPGEHALVLDAQTDDVSFGWVLIHLGARGNPPSNPDWRPSAREIDSAFAALERLHGRGLIAVGRIEYVDGGPRGGFAPVRHVAEPLGVVRQRVEAEVNAARQPTDWEFSCWVVATRRATA